MIKDIFELAKKANESCELNNSDTRYWIDGGRYFICNNVTEMENIDEVSEKEFRSRIERFLK